MKERGRSRKGQSLVETTLVLLVFLSMLLGVFDCGQVLFAHQASVNDALRAEDQFPQHRLILDDAHVAIEVSDLGQAIVE